MRRPFVTLNIQNFPSSPNFLKIKPSLDHFKHASIFSNSFYGYRQHGQLIFPTKISQDKIVQGYSNEGLPFFILIDSAPETQKVIDQTFNFIDKYIVPFIEKYLNNLKKDLNQHRKYSRDLIAEIFSLHAQYAPDSNFTLALVATFYSESNKLFAAGFSVGNCGILLKTTRAGIHQLIASRRTGFNKNGFMDSKMHKRFAESSNIFIQPIEVGDEVLGYTYVPTNMETKVQSSCDSYNDSDDSDADEFAFSSYSINQKILNELKSEDSFADTFWAQCVKRNFLQIKSLGGVPMIFGDDIGIVGIKIPNQTVTKTITNAIKSFQDTEKLLIDVVENPNLQRSCPRFFRKASRAPQLGLFRYLLSQIIVPQSDAMIGALYLILFDIQHTQFASTARGSKLRGNINNALSFIFSRDLSMLTEDKDKLTVPSDLNSVRKSYEALKNYMTPNGIPQEISLWFNKACKAMDKYIEKNLGNDSEQKQTETRTLSIATSFK